MGLQGKTKCATQPLHLDVIVADPLTAEFAD
jgi:hypothetical protein